MKEYLFYQDNKKHIQHIQDTKDPISKVSSFMSDQTNCSSTSIRTQEKFRTSITNFNNFKKQATFQEESVGKIEPLRSSVSGSLQKRASISEINTQLAAPTHTEFSDETMELKYNQLSQGYVDEYVKAGFPPKVCAQLACSLVSTNRLQLQVLDIGCGKGFVGKFLRDQGFKKIIGLDCSKSLLEMAQDKKSYEQLERLSFGDTKSKLPEKYIGTNDFVICNSLINNIIDNNDVIFQQLHDCLKIGGFAIFATKLDKTEQNMYEQDIKVLEENGYWKLITKYQFYRYDMLNGKVGKFSPKKVLYLVYQRIDHEQWIKDKEAIRLAEIAEAERLKVVQEQMRLQMLADRKKAKAGSWKMC